MIIIFRIQNISGCLKIALLIYKIKPVYIFRHFDRNNRFLHLLLLQFL